MKKPLVSNKNQLFDYETAKQSIKNLFFISPSEEFSLTDIATQARASKSTSSRVLGELEKDGLITINKDYVVWRVKANISDSSYIKEKILFNLWLIYTSKTAEFLNEYYNNPKAIILFGSFRWGQDTLDSDIDIAVEIDDIEETATIPLSELPDLEDKTKNSVIELEHTIRRQINITLFSKNSVDLNLFNNIANGIVLIGFLEVKNEKRDY